MRAAGPKKGPPPLILPPEQGREAMRARPIDPFAASLTLLPCVVWGFNQVVAKIGFADVGPIARTASFRYGVSVTPH